jgi:hypothetical protein
MQGACSPAAANTHAGLPRHGWGGWAPPQQPQDAVWGQSQLDAGLGAQVRARLVASFWRPPQAGCPANAQGAGLRACWGCDQQAASAGVLTQCPSLPPPAGDGGHRELAAHQALHAQLHAVCMQRLSPLQLLFSTAGQLQRDAVADEVNALPGQAVLSGQTGFHRCTFSRHAAAVLASGSRCWEWGWAPLAAPPSHYAIRPLIRAEACVQ